jgi:hypothetical protein
VQDVLPNPSKGSRNSSSQRSRRTSPCRWSSTKHSEQHHLGSDLERHRLADRVLLGQLVRDWTGENRDLELWMGRDMYGCSFTFTSARIVSKASFVKKKTGWDQKSTHHQRLLYFGIKWSLGGKELELFKTNEIIPRGFEEGTCFDTNIKREHRNTTRRLMSVPHFYLFLFHPSFIDQSLPSYRIVMRLALRHTLPRWAARGQSVHLLITPFRDLFTREFRSQVIWPIVFNPVVAEQNVKNKGFS